MIVTDLWLLLIYSSIVNTSLLLCSIYGRHYLIIVFLYLRIISLIIWLIIHMMSYFDLLLIVFMFLVIPPFVLFFMKIFLAWRLEYPIKLVLLLFFIDVFILSYYFTLIFIKCMLIDNKISIYFIMFIVLLLILLLRNYVTLVIIY